jgi:hypothetical protein
LAFQRTGNSDRFFVRTMRSLSATSTHIGRSSPTGTNDGVNAWDPMAHDEKLKPEDFPVHTEQKKIVRKDGKTIAEGSDKKIAEDVAERLNAEEDLREQDRWSA